jgi:hypothetical protein
MALTPTRDIPLTVTPASDAVTIPLAATKTDDVPSEFRVGGGAGDLFKVTGAGVVTAGGSVVSTAATTPRVDVLTQTIGVADLTDNEDATGTIQMTNSVPVGALVLGTQVLVTAGFAGDTSCTITIGDDVDADRYHTGTPSVFATAASGIAMGPPSGTTLHLAAVRPTIVLTSATDFSAVVAAEAGAMVVSIYYIATV